MADREIDLTVALTQLALTVMQQRNLNDDLERLLRLTTQLVPVSSGATIGLLVDGDPTTVALSDHVALELDLAQYESGDGPCIEALGGDIVRVAYLPEDGRFPHFAVKAADQRVVSVLSTPILHRDEIIGTLNLYSRQRDAFGETERAIAELVVAQAAHAIVKSEILATAHDIRERLQVAYDEEMLVARASGLLMAYEQCSAEQAGRLIRNASVQTQTSIIDTAQRIIATGTDRESSELDLDLDSDLDLGTSSDVHVDAEHDDQVG